MAVIVAVMMPVFIIMLAFTIDCGYLLRERAKLQRTADAAALAAVRELVPDSLGNQDLDAVRAMVRQYVSANLPERTGFSVLDADIEIGRYDPETIYSEVTLLDDGILDTVRVTLRRDAAANGPVSLFFTGIFGIANSEVRASACAVLQKARYLQAGVGVIPFSIPESQWLAAEQGDSWSIYGDGRITDGNGNKLPGNWGTLNLGPSANSTATINDQVLNGLQQSHLDALHSEGRIPDGRHIDSQVDFSANGDPGLSGGMKQSLQEIIGETRLIPIYDSVSNHGATLEFSVVGWAVALVRDVNFQGEVNTYLEIEKSYTYDGFLRPNTDLSVTEGVIEGAFTIPTLVE
jgi:hypothetical protein